MVNNLNIRDDKIVDFTKRRREIEQREELLERQRERKEEIRQKRRLVRKIKFYTKVGIAVAVLGIGAKVGYDNFIKEEEPVKQESIFEEESYNVALTDLNELNLVLVDDGVKGDFALSLQEKLEEDGIDSRVIDSSENLTSLDGTETLVSLIDYGTDVKVIAQYDERENQTDPLAVALNNSFQKDSLTTNEIQCGIHAINENGNQELAPSIIENEVGEVASRFVTIAVNADDVSLDAFKDSFEVGLSKFNYYVNHEVENNLITRIAGGKYLSDIAEANGVSEENIKSLNGIQNQYKKDQTVRLRSTPKVLRPDTEINIEKVNSSTKGL